MPSNLEWGLTGGLAQGWTLDFDRGLDRGHDVCFNAGLNFDRGLDRGLGVCSNAGLNLIGGLTGAMTRALMQGWILRACTTPSGRTPARWTP